LFVLNGGGYRDIRPNVDLSFEVVRELSESIVDLVSRYNTDLIDLSELGQCVDEVASELDAYAKKNNNK